MTALRITSMFTLCSSYICSLDPSVQYCTVRLQVRLSVHCTKSHLQKPILSLFRIHNVISVHCELRKRADQQIFTQQNKLNTPCFWQKKRRKSANETKINFKVMPRETVKYFHIFLHYSTVLKGSGSQFFQDSNELLQEIRHRVRVTAFSSSHTKTDVNSGLQ